MLLSHEKKFIFIHIPKTGGSSIHQMLVPWLVKGPDKDQDRFTTHNWGRKHGGLQHRHVLFKEHSDYLICGFTRNPWDKVWAHYWFHRRHMPRIVGNWSFEESVIKENRQDNALVPISKWLFNPKSPYEVGFVGRFERLQEDFEKMCGLVGIENAHDMRHANKNPMKPQGTYHEHYTKETRAVVAKIFKEDIRRWGYTFD